MRQLARRQIFQIVSYSGNNRGRTAIFMMCFEPSQYVVKIAVRPRFFLTGLPGGNSEWEPPDPISNSEVKTLSADGSVGSPHVRVGHRQDLIRKAPIA